MRLGLGLCKTHSSFSSLLAACLALTRRSLRDWRRKKELASCFYEHHPGKASLSCCIGSDSTLQVFPALTLHHTPSPKPLVHLVGTRSLKVWVLSLCGPFFKPGDPSTCQARPPARCQRFCSLGLHSNLLSFDNSHLCPLFPQLSRSQPHLVITTFLITSPYSLLAFLVS